MDTTNIVKHLREQAKKKIEKTGGYMPRIYFLMKYPENATPVYTPIGIEQFLNEKGPVVWAHMANVQLPQYLKQAWTKKRIELPGIELLSVVMISDAWISHQSIHFPKGFDLMQDDYPEGFVKPSSDPKSRTVLQITIQDHKSCICYYQHYKDKKGKVTWEEMVISDESNTEERLGWIYNLYPHE